MKIINVLYALWLWTTLFRPRDAAIAVAVNACWNPLTGITTFLMSLLCDLVVKYYLILPPWPRTITLIHHTRHYWWGKSNVTWVLRGETCKKIFQCNKSQLSLFILDNRKWRTFHLKDDNGKLWVELIVVTFLDAVATIQCRCPFLCSKQ